MTSKQVLKINKLKNFGSFEDFSWSSSLPEFKRYNLIYGQNGSGKTTLSKLFQCYENSLFPEDYHPIPSVEIATNDGVSAELSFLKGQVKVFNSYYVQDNISWEDAKAKNLLLIGKKNIEIQVQIDTLNAEIKALEIAIPKLEKNTLDIKNDLDNLLKTNSKTIRTVLGYPQSKYQSPNLKEDYDNLISGQIKEKLLDDKEYDVKRKLADSSSAASILNIHYPPALLSKQLNSQVSELLEVKTIPTVNLQELMENPVLKKWVQDGLTHHLEAGDCKFCSNKLTEERLSSLQRFFDDAQRVLTNNIRRKAEEIALLKTTFSTFNPINTNIIEEYKNELDASEKQYLLAKNNISETFDFLQSVLLKKEQDLFSDFSEINQKVKNLNTDDLYSKYSQDIAQINSIYEKHNSKVKNFDVEKKAAQRAIEVHWVSEQKTQYQTLKDKFAALNTEYVNSKLLLKGKIDEQISLKKQISNSHIAAQQSNNILKCMGHSHIALEYDESEQAYHLKRGGIIAKRLSEGEKTAIAFAHFIVSLQEEGFLLSESVIVIDDPISSLDATSCYFVYGLIKSLEQKIGQLFIMTHSYSFFVLLIKHFRDKKLHGHYEVHRYTKSGSDVGYSKLVKMEEERVKYFSEYNYLFSRIYSACGQIKSGENIGFNELYSLMNCSRKLMEAFLGFKYPNIHNLEDKWKQAVIDYKIDLAIQLACFRVINFGSHSGVDGLMSGSGLEKSEMAESTVWVLELIKTIDKSHFEGMLKCMGAENVAINSELLEPA